MALRVCCLDESEICLNGLKGLLEQANLEWLGGFQQLHALTSFFQQQRVDVLISEIRVDHEDMLEFLPNLTKMVPDLRLIIYSLDENPTHIARAAANHAWDYVPKRQSVQRLVTACDSVAKNQRCPDSFLQIAKQYLHGPHSFVDSQADSLVLTKREKQVLAHLSLGLSNREIASSMSISLETVKEHVQNVLRKLKVSDRTAAAVWAIRNGLPSLRFDTTSLLASSNPMGTTAGEHRGY